MHPGLHAWLFIWMLGNWGRILMLIGVWSTSYVPDLLHIGFKYLFYSIFFACVALLQGTLLLLKNQIFFFDFFFFLAIWLPDTFLTVLAFCTGPPTCPVDLLSWHILDTEQSENRPQSWKKCRAYQALGFWTEALRRIDTLFLWPHP